jgi:peptidoglycan/xylan/chitin deacetylase (PgdA/CDA1 family)
LTQTEPPALPGGARIAVVLQIVFELWSDSRTDALGFVPKLPDATFQRGMPDLLNDSLQRYGAEAGMPRLTSMLDRLGLPATGVMSGLAVERYPRVVTDFAYGAVAREICAHSWTQDMRVCDQSRDELQQNVERCAKVIESTTGRRPVGWVSPAGLSNPDTPEVLVDAGFLYHGDWAHTDSYDVTSVANGRIVQMSVPWEVNDASQYARSYHPPSAYVELFKRSFDVLYREGGGVLGAVAHAMIYGRPFGVSALEEVIEYARGHEGVAFTTRAAIAEWALRRDGTGDR